MAGPNDHDFDDSGRLRDISDAWSSYEDECRRLSDSDDRFNNDGFDADED